MVLPPEIIHQHADFQTGVSKLLALYFNELAGRPMPDWKLARCRGLCLNTSIIPGRQVVVSDWDA